MTSANEHLIHRVEEIVAAQSQQVFQRAEFPAFFGKANVRSGGDVYIEFEVPREYRDEAMTCADAAGLKLTIRVTGPGETE